MAYWTFPTDNQDWGSGANWTGDEGHPPGCLNSDVGISGLSLSVNPDDPCSFWCKIVITGDAEELETPLDIDVGLIVSGADLSCEASRTVTAIPYDSGWFKVTGSFTSSGTVTDASLTESESEGGWGVTVYFDSIYMAESEPDAYGLTHSGGGMPGAVMV